MSAYGRVPGYYLA